ncbi:hypothetical protein KVG96_14685 [Pseudomonas sp. COR58]|uniref:Uncharacterized protein n=1 Tax=Pseudomonas ekonensis TaxID=2842353 RepID=A0ABS6PFE3_9PSED|nr:hypothetical protein [Pseudomonas ekonensis]MBV4459202.1 hypothetical protein [Pseudomonas ekonensis]
MAGIPTPQDFYELSLIFEYFVDRASKSVVSELDKFALDGYLDSDLSVVVAACNKILKDIHKDVLGDRCKATLEWFEAEPAYAMAFKTVGFVKVDENYWEAEIRQELERWLPRFREEKRSSTSYVAMRIARFCAHYTKFVSYVARASFRYTSGVGYRTVIEGPSILRRLKELITEVDEVLSVEWLPDNLRTNLAYSLRTKAALRDLESCSEITSPVSRRNDADLPSRLFASDLLKMNQVIFNSFQKKAVFHLMGLSFVARPLEMRTIERLAKSEVEAHREIAAKRISDKRGLDFNQVLSTLKANKSFSLPRENID